MFTRRLLAFCLTGGLLLEACFNSARNARAWGGEGHAYAAGLAIQCLPEGPLRSYFTINAPWFTVNSSWPDRWRTRPDNAEAARHFLDGEHFGVGTELTKLPRDYKDLVKIRSYEQLRTDGLVPWTANRQYKLLVLAFREKRWDDVMVHAAYLSHYTADAHVPFHATENYDGQLSTPSQKGVHARFETRMVQMSITPADLHPGPPAIIKNPVTTILAATQDSLAQVPVILAADKNAADITGGDYNEAYWAAFTPKARPIAIARLESAGRTLAGLLLAAWKDGGSPTPPKTLMTDRLMPYAPAFVPRGQTAAPAMPLVTDEQKDAARTAAQTLKIASKLLNHDISVSVSLPADYAAPANSKTRYPVVYLLHGSAGGSDDWLRKTGAAAYAQEFGFILVMPDASPGGADSWYLNSPQGGKYEDFFIQELLPAIDKQFRTNAKREGRALIGNSMGGYGAWRIGLDFPSKFMSAASLSGALNIRNGDPAGDQMQKVALSLYGGSDAKAALKKFDADQIAPRIAKRINSVGTWSGPALYFDTGKDDFLVAGNRRTEQFLLEQNVPYEFAEFPGGHEWTYWDEHVRDALQFTARHVAPPQ